MFDGFNDIIRLEKGERLSEAMEHLSHETNVRGGWLNGLGGAQEVTLGFYDLEKKEYQWKTFTGLREVLSLTGNLARDDSDKFVFHLHGVFGDPQFQTIGGHVKDLIVGATLEIFLHRTYKPLNRKPDAATGLNLLDI